MKLLQLMKRALIRDPYTDIPVGLPARMVLLCCGNYLPQPKKVDSVTCPACNRAYDSGGWIIPQTHSTDRKAV